MSNIITAMQQNGFDNEMLRKIVKIVSFKKGEMVLQAHQTSDYLHVIQEGLVKIYAITQTGDEAIAVIYGKNDMFPLSWIIKSRKKSFYCQAISDCKIALIPQEILLEQMKTNAGISFAMSQRILEQYELYASRISNLEFKYGRERLAYRLLLLGARFGQKIDNTTIIPRISQQDLAGMINTSRESLSREMSRFERLNVMKYTNNSIVIVDEAKLRAELGEDASVLFYDPEY